MCIYCKTLRNCHINVLLLFVVKKVIFKLGTVLAFLKYKVRQRADEPLGRRWSSSPTNFRNTRIAPNAFLAFKKNPFWKTSCRLETGPNLLPTCLSLLGIEDVAVGCTPLYVVLLTNCFYIIFLSTGEERPRRADVVTLLLAYRRKVDCYCYQGKKSESHGHQWIFG